ncbi:MAG: hypothetical protein HZC47_08930 [Methanobacterium sp.]|nr:hypothetical protein [Methanobacterium sp.]
MVLPVCVFLTCTSSVAVVTLYGKLWEDKYSFAIDLAWFLPIAGPTSA